jgi:hypothetical protein
VDWSRHFVCCATLPLCPLGPPIKRILHFCESQRAVFTAKWMVFGPADVAQPPLHQTYSKRTDCWTRDLWLLVDPDAGVTPLTRLQNLPRPQRCCRSGPLLRDSRCPKTVHISGLAITTQLTYAHSSQAADRGMNIQPGLLLRI